MVYTLHDFGLSAAACDARKCKLLAAEIEHVFYQLYSLTSSVCHAQGHYLV